MTASKEKRAEEQQPPPLPPSSLVIHQMLDTFWGIALLCIPMVVYGLRCHDPELPHRSVFATEKLFSLSLQCTSAYGVFIAVSAALGLLFACIRRLRHRRILWLYAWIHGWSAVALAVIYIDALTQVYYIRDCAVKLSTSAGPNNSFDSHRLPSQLDACAADSGTFLSLAEHLSGNRLYGDGFCAPDFTHDCVKSVFKFVMRTTTIAFVQIAILMFGQLIVSMECVCIYRILAAAGSRTSDDDEGGATKIDEKRAHQSIATHGKGEMIDV